jgi:hypothetical protein
MKVGSFVKGTMWLGIFLFICSVLGSQENPLPYKRPSPKEAESAWKKMLKLCPPTAISSELELIRSIPSGELEKKDIYLWGADKLAANQKGEYFVVDGDWCRILRFDEKGDLIATIGRKGQGPGEFQNPICLDISNDHAIISDTGNYNIQYFDFDGNLTKSFKVFKAYIEIAIGDDPNLIYAVPISVKKGTPLVDVLDGNGRLLYSIVGPRFNVQRGWNLANMIKLDVNKKGEILIAFRFFPLVCKYSPKGQLLAEWRVDNDCLREKEKNNLEWTSGAEGVVGLKPVFFSLRASDSGFFLLLNNPRTQILEFDENGIMINDYWLAWANDFYASDFLVEDGNNRQINILENYPDPRLLVFHPKAHK